jgi:hypothetical protein
MKITLVRQQLQSGDMLSGDRVMRGIRNDRIAVSVIVSRGEYRVQVRKHCLAELDGVRFE